MSNCFAITLASKLQTMKIKHIKRSLNNPSFVFFLHFRSIFNQSSKTKDITDNILLRHDGSHVVQVQGGCPAPVAAPVYPEQDGGVLGVGVGHHHVQVEAVLAQRRVGVPLLGSLKARPHRVLDLDAGVGKPGGLLDPLPLINGSGMAKPEDDNNRINNQHFNCK